MFGTILASTALLATSALAQSVGSAVVVNSCSYDVTLTNVPASGGGESQIGPNTLAPGGSYSQEYTQLSNGDGWSIKLSKSSAMSDVMQYEYTWTGDSTIWFDLSDVNGNPWDGDWLITADGDCDPKQTAYMYSTDDEVGEQSCPVDSTITVTLCALSGGSSTSAAASAASSPAETATTSSTTTPSSTTTSSPTTTYGQHTYTGHFGDKAVSSATTLATVVKQGHTVTHMHTVVVTTYVHGSKPTKRADHIHRHMEHHNF